MSFGIETVPRGHCQLVCIWCRSGVDLSHFSVKLVRKGVGVKPLVYIVSSRVWGAAGRALRDGIREFGSAAGFFPPVRDTTGFSRFPSGGAAGRYFGIWGAAGYPENPAAALRNEDTMLVYGHGWALKPHDLIQLL